MSKLFLMPGLVGLGLLDAFALQTPLVTTDVDFHSPEIAYLESERNGLILPHDVDAYVDGVVSLLTDERRRAELVEGCRRASNRYTIEEMASRFADGVFAALGHMQTNRTTG